MIVPAALIFTDALSTTFLPFNMKSPVEFFNAEGKKVIKLWNIMSNHPEKKMVASNE
jgi:hypothetical protein